MIRYEFVRKRNVIVIGIIDFIGYLVRNLLLFFRAIRIKKVPSPDEVRKILLIRLDHIGDFIMTIPAIKAVRQFYPKSKISLLVGDCSESFARHIPYVDDIIHFSPFWFERGGKKHKFGDILRLVSLLRRERYDIGFDFRGYFYHILLMFFSGVKYRVGYGATGGGFLLDLMPEYRREMHEMKKSLELLRSLGHNQIEIQKPKIFFPDDFVSDAELLKKFGITKDFFAIAPFAGRREKEWDLKNWATLVELLLKEYPYEIVVLGQKDREDETEAIMKANERVKNIVGKTEPLEWAKMISLAKLLLSVDSASAHIGAVQSVPTVVIASGINSLSRWHPVGERVKVIVSDMLPCYPCERKNGCKNMRCLKLITPELVFETIKRFIDETNSYRLQAHK